MNLLKKMTISCTFITCILALSSFSAFAAANDYPENFINFTPEQCIQWLDENVKPVVEQGILVSNPRNIVRDYRTLPKENYAYGESGARVVGLRVIYYWRVNMDSTIEYYGMAEHTPLIVNHHYKFLNKNVTSFYVNPGNVKICPDATFASAYMGILVGQNVNLHSSGAISYTPVSFSY